MGFQSEAAMQEVAKDLLGSKLTGGPTSIIEEFSYGSGRADLVLARESRAYREHRFEKLGIDQKIERDSFLRAFLLLHSRDAISREYYYELGALNKKVKKQALDWLIEHGFVRELPDGKIQTACHLRRHVTRSYTVELKLSKWQTAIEQAFRAKSFSDYQFVALDEEHSIPAINNMAIFEEHEIGLISMNEEEFVVHHDPSRGQPFSPINKWRLNERTIEQEPKAIPSAD